MITETTSWVTVAYPNDEIQADNGTLPANQSPRIERIFAKITDGSYLPESRVIANDTKRCHDVDGKDQVIRSLSAALFVSRPSFAFIRPIRVDLQLRQFAVVRVISRNVRSAPQPLCALRFALFNSLGYFPNCFVYLMTMLLACGWTQSKNPPACCPSL